MLAWHHLRYRKDNNKTPAESILLPITTHLVHFLNKVKTSKHLHNKSDNNCCSLFLLFTASAEAASARRWDLVGTLGKKIEMIKQKRWGTLGKLQLMLRKAAKALYQVTKVCKIKLLNRWNSSLV